jgi:hypothetical protein
VMNVAKTSAAKKAAENLWFGRNGVGVVIEIYFYTCCALDVPPEKLDASPENMCAPVS